MAAGHIADGVIDDRNILDVEPADLQGFSQHHFFAGIGGWSYALRLAGWPDNQPVWTGSCPCQPFSQAGGRAGFVDERHLWPAWHYLITQQRPSRVYGEQVASATGLTWLDLVQTDLEGEGYAVGAFDLSAASVGSPQMRPRLWFSAQRVGDGFRPRLEGYARHGNNAGRRKAQSGSIPSPSISPSAWSDAEWLECEDGWRPSKPGIDPVVDGVSNYKDLVSALGNSIVPQVAAEIIEASV